VAIGGFGILDFMDTLDYSGQNDFLFRDTGSSFTQLSLIDIASTYQVNRYFSAVYNFENFGYYFAGLIHGGRGNESRIVGEFIGAVEYDTYHLGAGYEQSGLIDVQSYNSSLNSSQKVGKITAHITNGYICGDINYDKMVDMGDVILLLNHVTYNYEIRVNWTGDVTCGEISVGSVILLLNNVTYNLPLNCCPLE